MLEGGEARIATQGIEVGVHFHELDDVGLLRSGAIEPDESVLVVVESEVGVYERAGGDITVPGALLHFCEEPKCVGAPPGVSIGADQDGEHGGTAMREGDGFLQGRDRLLRLVIGS